MVSSLKLFPIVPAPNNHLIIIISATNKSSSRFTDCVRGIQNEGMPIYQHPGEKGDLYIKFVVEFPPSYFADEEQLKVGFIDSLHLSLLIKFQVRPHRRQLNSALRLSTVYTLLFANGYPVCEHTEPALF